MEPTGSAPSTPSSPLADRRSTRRTTYRTRLLASLATVLLLLIVATQLPWGAPLGQVGWSAADAPAAIQISEFTNSEDSEVSDESSAVSEAATPPTSFERSSTEPEPEVQTAPVNEQNATDGEEDQRSPAYASNLLTVDSADESPEMIGGEGSLYLRIHYPEEARQKGIQGRLVLSFVVDENGYTHDISVRESLHPLCDSAAVRALRETQFVPARQNGKRVPVRMSLPVRFKLLSASQEAMANTSSREKRP